MPRFLLFLIVSVCLSAANAGALDVPKLSARVTDLAGLLTDQQIRDLESKLSELESTDSTQIAILLIPSLQGEVLEDYSHRVASEWRLGQKGRDNGALLLIAMKERKVRIEVGYGLEAKLTDALARRVIQEEIVPSFRQGHYFGGIDAAATAIIQIVRGSYQATQRRAPETGGGGPRRLDWIIFLFIPLLWALSHVGKWANALLGAGAGAFIAYILAGPILGLLLFGSIIGLILGLLFKVLARASQRHPGQSRWHGSSGGWTSGGFSGFSGGGSSGGGFSGGGGSFGGGGSSGSW